MKPRNDIWVKNIYFNVLELSDLEKQKTLWLGRDADHTSSYVEIMCRLFDDNKFDNFIDTDGVKAGVSQEVIVALDRLRMLLNDYKEKDTDAEILADPKWNT